MPDNSVEKVMRDEKFKRFIAEESVKAVKQYLQSSAFTSKKVTDTPTDSNQVVPRGYVTANGSVAGRPTSSVAVVGQFFLSTDTNTPMWFTSGGWRNGSGSIVAGA